MGILWGGPGVWYVYLPVFCELSGIERADFILESHEFERILGVTPCPRELVFLPASGRELKLPNIFLTVHNKNNV